ncbi:MAG: polysaccharide biosynthesis tyrosine autokinase, partial [Acidobacteria bacterium]|nr:polysaccharide biosynthesis tyrosine autokinase [Acidobacteriota bacterium]
GYGTYGDVNQPDEFQLINYWRIIRKRFWLVIGITVLLTTLAAIYVARKPDIYQARAVIQVDQEQPNQELVTSDRRAPVSTQDPSYFNTQLQLLYSESLLRRVVKELSLDSNKEFQKAKAEESVSALKSVLRAVGLASDTSKKREKGVDEVSVSASTNLASSEEIAEAIRLAPYVDIIKKNLGIEPVRESRVTVKDTRWIELTYRNTNPELAALIVNGIGEVFTKTNQEKRTGTSRKTNDFLQERIANLQSEIRAGEVKLFELSKTAGILRTDNEQTIVLDRLSGLNKQLLEEYQPTAFEVTEVEAKIKAHQDEIKKATASSEADLASFRKRVSTDLANNLKTKYLTAKAKEDQIKSAYSEQYNQAQGQNQSGVMIGLLKQDIETKKGFLEDLTKQQKGNDIQAVGTDNNINVAEIAIPPDMPIAPSRVTTVLAALFLSTLFGMGLALFLEYLDDTIRTTEEIENFLGLPALAAIPRIDSLPKRRLLLVGGNEDGQDASKSELLIHMDSRSSLAEAYRQLRTSILLSTAGHAPKSLLVTSSLPSEGKTTTAINTAISLAQTGAKVLIIDADMRRPRIHSVFNISNADGLSTLLSNELIDRDIAEVIEFDEASNLNILTSGPVPPNPAELIGSEQMTNLLSILQEHFTHVVVDSPPIASFTDGVLVASMVDGVILVVNAGRSSRQVIRRSRQLLQDIGAKILGVVLNNVNLKSQDNNYYYQSYYHRDSYNYDDE